jgi:hypothetical protein
MATIEAVAGTDTPNTGRVKWNTNDTNMNVELIEATADIAAHVAAGNTDHDGRYSKITDLTTHKSASDHDSRYYTETEVDAMAVKLTGDQNVDGAKTFLDPPVVKHATASVEFEDASGNETGRILSVVANTTDRLTRLQAWKPSAGAYVDVIRGYAEDGSADSDLDLYEHGKRLATQEYVQSRVRSGFFYIPLQRYIASGTAATTYAVQDKDSQTLVVQIPNGAVLKKARLQWFISSTSDFAVEDVAVVFSDSGYTWITAEVAILVDDRYMDLNIYAWRIVAGTPTSTKVATVQYAKDDGFGASAIRVAIGLEFSL